MASIENITTLDAWKDALDMQGPSIDIETLGEAIDAAPQAIRESPDYQFFMGYLYGRQVEMGALRVAKKITTLCRSGSPLRSKIRNWARKKDVKAGHLDPSP